MSGIDDYIASVTDRDALHRFIDEQPDDANIIVITDNAQYACTSKQTVAQANTLADLFKIHILTCPIPPKEQD